MPVVHMMKRVSMPIRKGHEQIPAHGYARNILHAMLPREQISFMRSLNIANK